ncbi:MULTISPECIES: DUF6916 family protein [Roseateles]|uniref:DUF6916 domain-containing protein n=1 Tax=Pelomonas caseinilytica TaxID=2906763 RepID=A0ABS8X8S7_9BURK|nr:MULTISPECIES: hypothetical protein [unclassified Roseateles]MCE4537161.1 hypothetical protein [Pelomonas sp. P7]HEV6968245.1 hypothetical protein [Roseateles sp.]
MADAAFTLARFEPLVGSRFLLRLDDAGGLPARLVQARAGHGGAADRPPFSLTFEAPAEPALPQRIYRLEHPQLDAVDLFLVPVARTATGLHYEAVFG